MLSNGVWLWGPARSDELVEIQLRLPEVPIGAIDKPVSMISKKGRYMSHETWDEIRLKNPTVDWWKVIWFRLAIPKHSLIMWLATKNCLTTGDRLIKWGYKGAVVCFFVGVKWRLESIPFLNVASAPESGQKGMARCRISQPLTDWEDVVHNAVQEWRKKSLKANLVD